jgi:hypothetical protein
MQYSWAGGKLIHEKNQTQKISWHCPFNPLPDSPLFIPILGFCAVYSGLEAA